MAEETSKEEIDEIRERGVSLDGVKLLRYIDQQAQEIERLRGMLTDCRYARDVAMAGLKAATTFERVREALIALSYNGEGKCWCPKGWTLQDHALWCRQAQAALHGDPT